MSAYAAILTASLKRKFILVLLFNNYCIFSIQTTVNLLLPHPVYMCTFITLQEFYYVGKHSLKMI